MLSGASSNKALRILVAESEPVRVSTIEGAGSDAFRLLVLESSLDLGIVGRWSFGDSGEKDGKEVRDLSDMEEAELVRNDEFLRYFARYVCDRVLLVEATE